MDKLEREAEIDAVGIAKAVCELIGNIEMDALRNKPAKECKELLHLKEMCCSKNVIVSMAAFNGIVRLVEKKILAANQAISSLIALLPSLSYLNTLVSAVGNIMLFELNLQLLKSKTNIQYPYSLKNIQHPFVIILKYNGDKSWFEIYSFICNLIEDHDELNIDYKINLLRPVFHYVFENPNWIGSQFQVKLFSCLVSKIKFTEYFNFAMELLIWTKIDIQHCFFLREVYKQLVNIGGSESTLILSALNPYLAENIKWIIKNGYNPSPWLELLNNAIQNNDSSLSVILYILSDIILETPPPYISELFDICRSIIFSASCNRYIASKFIVIALKWLVQPTSLPGSVYKTLEEIVLFVEENENEWNDQTNKLVHNKYFESITSNNCAINFAVNLICLSNNWQSNTKKEIMQWIKNLLESNEPRISLELYALIGGIIFCENDKNIIQLCLELLFYLVNYCKKISFVVICLLFYKLARETNPKMQKIFLFSLPKLALTKDNISLIIGIINSLKKGEKKIMSPLIVQLFLELWKSDDRTYSYLHKLLQETSAKQFDFEINLSKAIALREICRLAPHSHGKEVINVLSKVLNESSDSCNGLPSAFAIEAIIELCKAYVIDVLGTWNALQPILSIDKRIIVMKKMIQFFGEIPSLSSSVKNFEQLHKEIVTMLWNFTFSDNLEISKLSYRALSKFDLNNFDLTLMPEQYRVDLDEKIDQGPSHLVENFSSSIFIPPECWLLFLDNINTEVLTEGLDFLKAVMERDLELLPRGLFYLPPDKSEPQSYSYLPRRSVCRAFVNQLLEYCKISQTSQLPNSLVKIIHVLSFDYNKLLPPLNWQFLSDFIFINSNLLILTLGLLIKQSSVSKSAKILVVNSLTDLKWSEEKEELIIYLYIRLPNLCKAISQNVFSDFLMKTLKLSLKISLEKQSDIFEKILHNLTEALKNKDLDYSYKTAIVKSLENILLHIPPKHKIMRSYASCATEFPLKSIENIAVIDEKILSNAKKKDYVHRAIIIRHAIAMRSEVKNPLTWFNEIIDAAINLTEVKNVLLDNLSLVIKNRRDGNHINWLQELMNRIKSCIQIVDSKKIDIALYLLDIFINSIIILSGCDSFIYDLNHLSNFTQQKIEFFPYAFKILINFSEWIPLQSKLSLWLQQLLKQDWLPPIYAKAFAKSVLFVDHYEEALHSHFLSIVLNNKGEEFL